jgi:hypothetical protein
MLYVFPVNSLFHISERFRRLDICCTHVVLDYKVYATLDISYTKVFFRCASADYQTFYGPHVNGTDLSVNGLPDPMIGLTGIWAASYLLDIIIGTSR